ncbi:MAG: aldo/keto reductase, partial [Solirubrobacteraceae bacterium]
SEAGTTPDALALAFVLSQPWVDVALSGATTAQQLQSNLGALDVDPAPLEDIVEDPTTYWHERSELPWN